MWQERILDEYEGLRLSGRECEAALKALRADQQAAESAGRGDHPTSGGSDVICSGWAGGGNAAALLRRRIGELEERGRHLKALRMTRLPLVRAVAQRLSVQ